MSTNANLVDALRELIDCQPDDSPIWDSRKWECACDRAREALIDAVVGTTPTVAPPKGSAHGYDQDWLLGNARELRANIDSGGDPDFGMACANAATVLETLAAAKQLGPPKKLASIAIQLRDCRSAWDAIGCSCGECPQCDARAINLDALADQLDDIDSQSTVPKGWKLVPEGTTWDMRNGARELLINFGVKAERLDALAVGIWETMLDAAPRSPSNDGSSVQP